MELFTLYASGQLDGTSSIPDELVSAIINCLIGKSKQEMVRVSTKVKVGEAVSSLGQFIEYLYGKDDTTEEHCPSKKLAEKKGNGMPFTPTAQYARNVDVVIQCHECEKWRLLYAKNVVTRWEKTKLEKILEEVQYSCGSSLQDIDDESSILCRVFTRTNLLCSSPMEIPYYGTYHEPLCFYCGCSDVAEDDDLQDKYPICNNCLHKKPAVSKRKR